MNAQICFSRCSGTLPAVSSKSVMHRLLLAAALGDTPVCIRYYGDSDDISATMGCVSALGGRIEEEKTPGKDTVCKVFPVSEGKRSVPCNLDCGESGSTLRFLLPIAAALGADCTFLGRGRLPERPLSPLYELLTENGVTLSPQGKMPLTCGGKLRSGAYSIAGNISSQFITGLLFALPLPEGDSRLRITGKLESRPYVDLTLSVLRTAGISVKEDPSAQCFYIPGGQKYHLPAETNAEGDFSSAAFWLCAAAVSGEVTLTGLREDSLQGDKAILQILRAFGADITVNKDSVTCRRRLCRPIRVDASQIPDLVPILAVTAMAADGESRITGASRLRLKESDRLKTVTALLRALGGEVEELSDGLILHGKGRLHGGRVSAAGDHRITMSAAVASLLCADGVTVTGAEAVGKSYPRFFDDLVFLGGSVRFEENAT